LRESTGVSGLGTIPGKVIFFNDDVCNGFGDHKTAFIFHASAFIYILFPLYWHLRMKGVQLVSQHERFLFYFLRTAIKHRRCLVYSIALELTFESMLFQDQQTTALGVALTL
jgi:hypothetical protein